MLDGITRVIKPGARLDRLDGQTVADGIPGQGRDLSTSYGSSNKYLKISRKFQPS
jgi:hypothetical protein